MKFALGRLGWTEREYYLSSPEGFYYACQGYFDKVRDESMAIRTFAYMYYRWNGGKDSIDRIWPLDNDKPKEDKRVVMSSEEYKNILKRHQGIK